MKRLLLILLLISKIGFSQYKDFIYPGFEFEEGEFAYMFGNDVKLRDQPNTESNVLTLLKIGDEVEILEVTDYRMEYDGIESPWYKVKAEDKVGYVLGGLISLDIAQAEEFVYLIALKQDDSKLFIKTRLLVESDEGIDYSAYKENVSELMSDAFSIKASDNRGIENIDSILEIDYSAEACGLNGGGIYLFYNGDDLLKAIDYAEVSEGEAYYCFEEYIFPEEEFGVKGKIVYKYELHEMIDYETEWSETKTICRLLEWNGSEITPNPKTSIRED